MIAIVNNNAVVINNSTSRRANVIAQRTNSDIMGEQSEANPSLSARKRFNKLQNNELNRFSF